MTLAPDAASTLESGDRLTRAEFHRRYVCMPDIKKAELVNGVVYVASPARWGKHGQYQTLVIGWLFQFVADRPDVGLGDNDTVFLAEDGEVQPDAFLFDLVGPDAGAQVRPDGYIEGAPEFVVEIAASSVSYDLHDKKELYRRAGVREYLVWRTEEEDIDWFRLRAGEYVRIPPDQGGMIESETFPGLRLDAATMLAGDRIGCSTRSVADNLAQGRSTARRLHCCYWPPMFLRLLAT